MTDDAAAARDAIATLTLMMEADAAGTPWPLKDAQDALSRNRDGYAMALAYFAMRGIQGFAESTGRSPDQVLRQLGVEFG